MSTALSAPQQYPTPQPSPETPHWKQLLAERLEAHRAKSSAQLPPSAPEILRPSSGPRVSHSHIARAVASRYATQPTYSEVLAAAQEQAAQQAAEQAAAEARQAAEKRELLEALEAGNGAQQAADQSSALPLLSGSSPEGSAASANEREFAARYGSPIRTSPGTPVMPKFAERSQEMRLHQTPKVAEPTLEELLASSVIEPRSLLPSKLIEFPRELVSTHKSRPRLPDPPVTVNPEGSEESSQLRIFEVQPDSGPQTNPADARPAGVAGGGRVESQSASLSSSSLSGAPSAASKQSARTEVSRSHIGPANSTASSMVNRSAAPSATPTSINEAQAPVVRTFKGLEWASISLDKEPAVYSRRREATSSEYMPLLVEPASIDRRVMAFAVDFAAVSAAFLGFLVVFAAATPRLPSGLTAIALAATVYASLWLLYQLLFFSLSGATAGMLYARIALCTFDDQNPSRSAMRRRLAAWWLSCLPLGLGFFWSFMDEDNLSWHDRMTGMYQRTY